MDDKPQPVQTVVKCQDDALRSRRKSRLHAARSALGATEVMVAKRARISWGDVMMGVGPTGEPFARGLERQLGNLLNGQLPLNDFRRWFASSLWAAERSAGDSTIDFAHLIENRIAERSGEYISNGMLVDALRADALQYYGYIPGRIGSPVQVK